MNKMLSAQYNEDGVSYHFKMASMEGDTAPNMGRWEHYEELRIASGVTIDAYVGPTDLENWVEEMARSDNTLLPRWGEDILDGMPDKSGVAQITLDRLQAKKDKRGEKP
jgi:hypothetical protein